MEKKYVFGVDLGGTEMKFGLFSSEGVLLEKWTIPTRTTNQGEYILPDISRELKNKMQEHNISSIDVRGVGIGVPGAVLHDSFVAPCVNLEQWGGFDVAQSLQELCRIDVRIANDANVAALGELWQGSAKGSEDLVFVTLGTGVGGGIVVNGKLLSGTHGAGGEIGHIKVKDGETDVCGCGKCGCLEQYASASGLVKAAKAKLKNTNVGSTLRYVSKMTAKTIFDCARDGDPVACDLVQDFAATLGKALAIVSCVTNPAVIAIGGGVSAAGKLLLDAVQKNFVNYAFPSAENTEFRLAILGNDAGIYGAARLIQI